MMEKGSHIMLLYPTSRLDYVNDPRHGDLHTRTTSRNCDVMLSPMDIANILGSFTTRIIEKLRKFLHSTFVAGICL